MSELGLYGSNGGWRRKASRLPTKEKEKNAIKRLFDFQGEFTTYLTNLRKALEHCAGFLPKKKFDELSTGLKSLEDSMMKHFNAKILRALSKLNLSSK